MTLECSFKKKMDYATINLNDLKSIYNFDDRNKPNKREYVIISKKEYLNLQSAKKRLDEML